MWSFFRKSRRSRALSRPVILLSCVLFFGSGCASYTVAPPDGVDMPDNPGYLIGTVTIIRGMYESETGNLDTGHSVNFLGYTLYYRDADRFSNANSGRIGISANVYSRDVDEHFKRPNGQSFIFAVPLKPGEYVFSDYTLYLGEGVSWRAEGDFFIPFEIHAGEATYVGDWRAYALKGEKTFLGMVRVDGGFWTNLDMKEKDLEKIYAQHPDLRELPLNISVNTNLVQDYFGISDPLISN